MPLVTVIMPAYNAEKTVEAAVRSVLSQTFGDFELIIIDDCSVDSTQEIIRSIAEEDERVVFLRNEKNSGVSETRNRGVAVAKGKWIAFLDSDDMWREDKLERQLALTEMHPSGVLFYTSSSFISANGVPSGYVMEALEETDYKTLLRKNLISCSSAMVRTDVMRGIKMPGDFMHEDYFVWLTILRKYKVAYGEKEPLLIYRMSANSKSSGRLRSARMLYNSYRAVGYGVVSSGLMTLRYTVHSVTKRRNIKMGKN